MRSVKAIALFLVVGTTAVAPATAQLRVGPFATAIWAGVAREEADLLTYESARRWGGGIRLEVALGSRWTLMVEPMVAERGASGSATAALGGAEGTVETDVRLRYIEIPILARWDLLRGDVHPYLAAGASIGHLQSATVVTEIDGGAETIDVSDELNRTEAAVVFAAGVWARIGAARCFLEGRFTQGLLDLDASGETNLTNQSVGVLAGATFNLGGRS
jgi:hypothetical protein